MTKIDIKRHNQQSTISHQQKVAFTPLEKTTDFMNQSSLTGFTLLELLIVISIIAILAATIIPNFIGFDAEARIVATQTNLNNLRSRIIIFRSKEGRYPAKLEDLLEVTYNDLGVEKPFLETIPPEFISSKEGNATIDDLDSKDSPAGDGGWIYYPNKAKVVVDWDMPLDSKWGKAQGQVPSQW